MTDEESLRKWCLERAFETRALRQVAHMEVTNIARDYFEWIVSGDCQSTRALASARYQHSIEEPEQSAGDTAVPTAETPA